MNQKSLLEFVENEEKTEKQKPDTETKIKKKIVRTRKQNQIETDYESKDRIEKGAKLLRERFNVNIEIFPVIYGSKPPINQKIHGYYMLITVKSGDMDRIVEFLESELRLKVY